MALWRQFKQISGPRRLVSLLLLLGMCATIIPLPVAPAPTSGKDLSAPFPCQNRPCGCRSAAQCWNGCCCFSNAEKLAWAKTNNVTPPQFVVEAAAKEQQVAQSANIKLSANTKTSCCSKSAGCCSSHQTPESTKSAGEKATYQVVVRDDSPTTSICANPLKTQQRSTSKPTGVKTKTQSTNYAIGLFVQKCQGQGSFWNVLPWAVMPNLHSLSGIPGPNAWDAPASASAPLIVAEPPEPPPRLLVATV